MDLIETESFIHHVRALMEEWHTPGVSIAAFNDSKVSARGFGLASLNPEVMVTPETIFDCASTSKSLTAACIGKLVAANNFAWSTPVSELLPDEFVLETPTATAMVTVEDILSHRSGMPRHDWSYMGVKAQNPDTARSITENLRNLPLTAPPRTRFQYCNMMATVATFLVETVSKQSFARFLQENILDPLGMRSSYLQPSAVTKAGQDHRVAKPYLWDDDSQSYSETVRHEQPEAQGAGSIQSTVLDYAKWIQAMMSRDDRLFPSDVYAELIRPRILIEPEPGDDELPPFTSYELSALGWEVEFYRGYRVVKHDGAETGYRSLMLYMPEVKFGLVIFGNAGGAEQITNIIAMELVDEALGVPHTERVDWAAREREKAKKDDKEIEAEKEKLKKELLGGEEEIEIPQRTTPPFPLSNYEGVYSNLGYHEMKVQIKDDDHLYIDAMDRSMGFTIDFEHIRDGRIFIAHLKDEEMEDDLRAEFEIDENGDVRKMGIDLCTGMSPELVWFAREKHIKC